MSRSKELYIEQQSVQALDEWRETYNNRFSVEYTPPMTPAQQEQAEQSINISNIYYGEEKREPAIS